MIGLWFFGILLAFIFSILLYARWHFGKLEKLGIPVVKPHFLLGSTHKSHLKVIHLQDYEWFKQHGTVYGVYEGRNPQVHICDPELVRQIFVKNFEHFRERREAEFGDPVMNLTLDFIHPYEKWKAVRSAINPMFSTGRVKKTSTLISEALTDYIASLNQEAEDGGGKIEKANLFVEIFNMSIDMMARSIFSMKIENPKDPNNPISQSLLNYFQGYNTHLPKIFSTFALSFPILRKIVPVVDREASTAFRKLFHRVIQERKMSGEKKDDLVNQLVNLVDQIDTPEFKKVGMDFDTIMAQAVIFFIAGPEQFANVIAPLILFLAQNPETLRKLHKELDSFMEKNKWGVIQHEDISSLTYTNACIQEALRLSPPFIHPERMCTKDWEYNGIKIKKGMTVMLPLFAASRNPEYFPDPESFKPERWLPENKSKMHPYAQMTFGHGPRNCIAMRLSLEILPLIVANLIPRFDFKLRPDTELAYKEGNHFVISYEPIYVDIVPRPRVPSQK